MPRAVSLREWRREVERERRVDPVERIEDQLRNAVAREDYEEAARLRDQIQRSAGDRHRPLRAGNRSANSHLKGPGPAATVLMSGLGRAPLPCSRGVFLLANQRLYP